MNNQYPMLPFNKMLPALAVLSASVFLGSACSGRNELAFDLGDGVTLEVVKTPDNIWWGKFEVTQEQWTTVTGHRNPVFYERQDDPGKPVLNVGEPNIDEFLRKLNALPSVKKKGLVFRLPDRSEWEKACLAGSSGPWPLMADGTQGTLDRLAWYDGNWNESYEVGLKEPNAYGLYDMLGNVAERTTTDGTDQFGNAGKWFCGGDLSFEAADYAEGARSGMSKDAPGCPFTGFRVCAPAKGYVAPPKAPAAHDDPFPTLYGGDEDKDEDEVEDENEGNPPNTLATDGPTEPWQPYHATQDTSRGDDGVDNHPGHDGTPNPEIGLKTGKSVRAEATPESIMEMAKQQAAQKAAQGDWEGARKIMESARSVVEAFGGETDGSAPPSGAPQRDSGRPASNMNVDDMSIGELLTAAAQGDADAQLELGVRFFAGKEVPQDLVQAAKWFRLAAEQGNAVAQYNLGMMYADGLGVSKDIQEAIKWWNKAAEQGDAHAQDALGSRYAFGRDIAQDYALGFKWLRLAAEQGNANSQYNLGVLYSDGNGVPKDIPEAIKWWRLAAEQGDAAAQHNLGVSYAKGYGVPQDFQEANKWWRKAAEQGHTGSMIGLGGLFERGDSVPKSEMEAMKWYKKAADQNDKDALFWVGRLYFVGQDLPQDPAEGMKWFQRAAAQGDVRAMCFIGTAYYDGIGVSKDLKEAESWWKRAAENGSTAGQHNLDVLRSGSLSVIWGY